MSPISAIIVAAVEGPPGYREQPLGHLAIEEGSHPRISAAD
jgi:hypothetical protein